MKSFNVGIGLVMFGMAWVAYQEGWATAIVVLEILLGLLNLAVAASRWRDERGRRR